MKLKRLIIKLITVFLLICLSLLIIKPKAEDKNVELKNLYQEVPFKAHYQGLDDTSKVIYNQYDELFKTLVIKKTDLDNKKYQFSFTTKKLLPNINELFEKYKSVLYSYLLEHKEFFMFKGGFEIKGEFSSTNIKIIASLHVFDHYHAYYDLLEDYLLYIKEIKKIKEIIDHLNSDYLKIRYLHDLLITTNEYNNEALAAVPTNENALAHSPISALLDKYNPVCEGYAELFNILLNYANINNFIAVGNVLSGTAHAWNYVQINNKWYEIDLTFDDPIYGHQHFYNRVNYKYFLTPRDESREITASEVNQVIINSINSAKEYYWRFQKNKPAKPITTKKEPLKSYSINEKIIADYYHEPINFKTYLLTIKDDNTHTYEEIASNYQTSYNNNPRYRYLYFIEPTKSVSYIDYPINHFLINYQQLYVHNNQPYNLDNNSFTMLDHEGNKISYKQTFYFHPHLSLREIFKEALTINGYQFVNFRKVNSNANPLGDIIDPDQTIKDLGIAPNEKIILTFKKITLSVNDIPVNANFIQDLFKEEYYNNLVSSEQLLLGYLSGNNYYLPTANNIISSNTNLLVQQINLAKLLNPNSLTDVEKTFLGFNNQEYSEINIKDNVIQIKNSNALTNFKLPYDNIITEVNKDQKQIIFKVKGLNKELRMNYELLEKDKKLNYFLIGGSIALGVFIILIITGIVALVKKPKHKKY